MSGHGIEFLDTKGQKTARLIFPNQLAPGKYELEADSLGLVTPSLVTSKPYIILGNAPAPSVGNFPLAANAPLELSFAYREGTRAMLNDAEPTRVIIPVTGLYNVTGFFAFRNNSGAAVRTLLLKDLANGFVFGRADIYVPITLNRNMCLAVSGQRFFAAGSKFTCTAVSSVTDSLTSGDINLFQLQVSKV